MHLLLLTRTQASPTSLVHSLRSVCAMFQMSPSFLSVDTGILDTRLEQFDHHFAVNRRASRHRILEFACHLQAQYGRGRIIALPSDHVAGSLLYGASKGALARTVLAAAQDLSQ